MGRSSRLPSLQRFAPGAAALGAETHPRGWNVLQGMRVLGAVCSVGVVIDLICNRVVGHREALKDQLFADRSRLFGEGATVLRPFTLGCVRLPNFYRNTKQGLQANIKQNFLCMPERFCELLVIVISKRQAPDAGLLPIKKLRQTLLDIRQNIGPDRFDRLWSALHGRCFLVAGFM
jgi:hypothetical protein